MQNYAEKYTAWVTTETVNGAKICPKKEQVNLLDLVIALYASHSFLNK